MVDAALVRHEVAELVPSVGESKDDLGREEVELQYAYSTTGPVYLELLQSQPTGYYATDTGSELHHLGRWVDDLAAASASLTQQGLPLEAQGVGADGAKPALFAFHAGPHAVRIELVDRANQANFQSWLAGGSLSGV